MRTLTRSLVLLAVLAAVSCVTINIYFPAEEVRDAADKIVNEVWGKRQQQQQPPANDKGSFLLPLFAPATAVAAQNIDVSTPEIRAIKSSMKVRAGKLRPYLDSGHVGIGRDGLLEVRSTGGLDLRSRAAVARLVQEENADRKRLYRQIARANGFPDKVDEVQAIFADSYRANAASGWYLQQPNGSWKQK